MRRQFDELNLADILTDAAEDEDLIEVPLTERIFRVFFISVLVLSAIALLQLSRLSLLEYSFYAASAKSNMSIVKIERAKRGVINDRFGKPLLHNEPSFNVFLNPQQLPSQPEARGAVLEKITKILELNLEELYQRIKEKDWALSNRLFLTNVLTQEQLVALSGVVLPGVEIEPTYKRVHEVPFAFSHVLGYTGLVEEADLKQNPNLVIHDEIGKNGLEAYYDSYLRGVNGKTVMIRNAKGEVQEEYRTQAPQTGLTLSTFIDGEFQEYFYKRLQGALLAIGSPAGTGIALNPQNGEVLALFNIPSFDSSRVAEFLKDKHRPFFNRAISGLYTPGSTIKPLVAIAALKEGIVQPLEQIFSKGFIEIPNPYHPSEPSRFLDWKPHGWVDLYGALAKSSNIYFYAVGGGFQDQKGLGISKLKKWWERFKLQDKTEIDLPAEETGFLPDALWKEKRKNEPWYLGDTYNVSIGQGDLLITPIGLLNYLEVFVSGGKIYKPRIAKSVEDDKGRVVFESEPGVLQDLSDEIQGTLHDVEQGMREAVKKPYGTAYLLHDLPVSVAAKTGTSQIQNNAKTNAFFIGYAPVENPQLAILILVEESREGSLNTIPVAKDVFMWYYNNRIQKIQMTKSK